jgi:glucose-6-phosphate isomerase
MSGAMARQGVAMDITFSYEAAGVVAGTEDLHRTIKAHESLITQVQGGKVWNQAMFGWFSVQEAADPNRRAIIHAEAERVRSMADVMIVIGIGGSNRGAMAAVQALQQSLDGKTRLVWAGDTLSAARLKDVLATIRSSSVVLNVIAKDFNTVEPGISFRILRQAMQEKYGEAYSERIIATGSRGPGQLGELAERHGYRFLDFQPAIGGRFSVLSEVGLFPMAVAGIDIESMLEGAARCEQELKTTDMYSNPAVQYAAMRSILFRKGFIVESLAFFEPDLVHFARWWTQLFAETEGKNRNAIFPTSFSYSEDLHAVGQYVQQGRRCIMETFLGAFHSDPGFRIPASPKVKDGFDHLDGKAYDELNRAVYKAALQAHSQDGVPCMEIRIPSLEAGTLGALFYFFMFTTYLSASMLGVNPFTQDGVENYKRQMYRILGKPGYSGQE